MHTEGIHGVNNEQRFDVRVQELSKAGLLHKAVRYSPSVYIGIASSEGWKNLASQFIVGMPGISRTIAERHGISWQVGNKVIGYIVPPGDIPELHEAQTIAAEFSDTAFNCCSMGGLARKCVDYVGPAEKYDSKGKHVEHLLKGIQYGYMECIPGLYPLAHKFDVKSYYYNLALRMPHISPTMIGDRLTWPLVPKDEKQRLARVLEAVKDCKPLRNSMAGAMAGSNKWGTSYADNGKGNFKVIPVPPFNGGRRTAGLVLVRAGWEITRQEVDTEGTVYSRVDSIITLKSGTGAWKNYGLNVKYEHSGPADIVALGCYKVGDFPTRPYMEQQENLLIPAMHRWEGQVQEPEIYTRPPAPAKSYLDWL